MGEPIGPGGTGGITTILGLEQARDQRRVRGPKGALLRQRQERGEGEEKTGVQGARVTAP
jgi:hypothetical protein